VTSAGEPFSRRKLLSGFGALALGSAAKRMTPFGGKQPAAHVMKPGQSSGTLSLYTWVSGAGEAIFNQMLASYNSSHHGQLSFDFNTISASGSVLYVAKLKSLIAEGTPPALFTDWTHSLEDPFIEAGAVRNLGDWYQKYGWDKVLYKDAIDYILYKGQPYGVPIGLFGIVFWYHKSIFEKAGVSVPTTFDEFEKANATILKSGTTPLAMGELFGYDPMRVFEYLLEVTAGPALHDKLLNFEASWNNTAVVEAFALLKSWADNKWFTPGFAGINPNDADTEFAGGKAAMDLTLGAEESTLQQAGIPETDFGVFVGPTGHSPQRLSGFVEAWAINPKLPTSQLEQLGDFMNWFIQPTTSQKYFGFNGSTATVGGVSRSKNPINAKILDLLAAHPAYLVMDQALGQLAMNVFFNLQNDVMKGTTTPADAAKALQQAVAKYGASL
jgi:raffinose/stachyose/melibiose transport system substrate-binding protein